MSNRTMEPIVLIDKSKNKETHIVTSTLNCFEDVLASARRINKGLFLGEWDLSYIDPETNKSIKIDSQEELTEYIIRNVDTFYWNYQKPAFKFPFDLKSDHRNKEYRQKSRTKEYVGTKKTEFSFDTKRTRPDTVAKIQTLTYGDWTKRILAYMIDLAVFAVIVKVFKMPSAFIPWWLYYALLESSDMQATVGKMVMGLKVTDMNGKKLGFWKASIRHFGKYISGMLLGLGYALALFTSRRQALHDIFAEAIVVEDEKK